jgi:hypothetical protein
MSFVATRPLVMCAPPPTAPAPVLLPLVSPMPPSSRACAEGPLDLGSPLAAGLPDGKRVQRARSRASTTASLSESGSDDDSTGGEASARSLPDPRELPPVQSSLMSQARVRNTFIELPAASDDEESLSAPRRRARSAPPLGAAPWAAEEAEAGAACPEGVPSVGSLLHAAGKCKPCAFVHTKGCATGALCQFCHLCDSEEKKRRQKDRWEEKRAAWRQWRKQERRKAASQRQLAVGFRAERSASMLFSCDI